MQAMKCDRCGRYYELTNNKDDNHSIQIFTVNRENKGANARVVYHQCNQMDLCPKCYESFEIWLKYRAEVRS